MSSWLGQFHDFTKKYDPLAHYAVDHAWKSSSSLVNETSRGLQNWGDKWGINTQAPEYVKGLSEKDKNSFNRWGENTLAGIGAVLGGMYAYGAMGGGSSAGGTAGVTGADGAFLGEGTTSGIGAWDSAATGTSSSSGLSATQRNAISKALGGLGKQQGVSGTSTYQPTRSTSGYQAPNGFIDTYGGR